MTFISYAQNFEDVLLWRALGHIKNGFYIDVGANDPVEHSVTKAFYDAGWWGINVEPMPSYAPVFAEARPRDVNLAVAAGSAPGEITLYDTPSVNGWASVERSVAEAHRAEGVEVVEHKVQQRTLNDICAEHVRGDIHFLKIDVEGHEGDVLRGIDLARWRPWLLMVEATLPNSRATNHDSWEPLITGQRYRYAYFDGLNRYYVAEEHAELLDALTVQPNVFDAFISHHLARAWENGTAAQLAAQRADAALHTLQAEYSQAQQQRLDASERAAHAAGQALDAVERLRQAEHNLHESEQRKSEAERHSYTMEARIKQLEEQIYDNNQLAQAELQAALDEADAARAEARSALAEAQAAKEQAAQAYTEREGASVWGHSVERQLLDVYASSSWRLTAPLRALGNLRPRERARALLRHTLITLVRHEGLRRRVLQVLHRFPGLEAKVRHQVAVATTPPPEVREAHVPPHLVNLTASARRVLADLQRGRATPSSK